MNAESLKQIVSSDLETGYDMTKTVMMLLGLTPRPSTQHTHIHTNTHTKLEENESLSFYSSPGGKILHLKKCAPPSTAFQLLFKVYQKGNLYDNILGS